MRRVLFRYNDKTGEWKRIEVGLSKDRKSLLLVISQGTKGDKNTTTITTTLSLEEAYYFAHTLTLIADHLLHAQLLNGSED